MSKLGNFDRFEYALYYLYLIFMTFGFSIFVGGFLGRLFTSDAEWFIRIPVSIIFYFASAVVGLVIYLVTMPMLEKIFTTLRKMFGMSSLPNFYD